MNITTTKALDKLETHMRRYFPQNCHHLNDFMPDEAEAVIDTLEHLNGYCFDDGIFPFMVLANYDLIKALNHMLQNESISKERHDELVLQITPVEYEVFVFSY